tara:strand:- start:264 stop:473 length:210 start_codon:yes stop_codon:yes gene_type:complete
MLGTTKNTHLSEIISFYRQQIARFERIGIGNQTEFGTIVTQSLIDTTKKRLSELQDKRYNLSGRLSGLI